MNQPAEEPSGKTKSEIITELRESMAELNAKYEVMKLGNDQLKAELEKSRRAFIDQRGAFGLGIIGCGMILVLFAGLDVDNYWGAIAAIAAGYGLGKIDG